MKRAVFVWRDAIKKREVITIDFCSPLKSNRYNFLQPVIDAVNQGDKALAVTRARDIAAMLVPNDRTERIWLDGQRSILTMGILAVVRMEHPEYQNMPDYKSTITPWPPTTIPCGRFQA